jgi:hypothetical protein
VPVDDDPGLPIKFGPCSNGEYLPAPLTAVEREAIRRANEGAAQHRVKHGELFWKRIGDGDIHTNEGRELLLDPSPLLRSYTFELGPPATRLNRRALEVTASRRPGDRPIAH